MNDDVPIGSPPPHVNAWLYGELINAARGRDILSYTDVGTPLRLDFDNPNDRRRIGELLGEISRYEVAHGRPMLSALVWHKDNSGAGEGLFNLGMELGLVRGNETSLDFATRQATEVHTFWATGPNRSR
jgi:hypothetical protein